MSTCWKSSIRRRTPRTEAALLLLCALAVLALFVGSMLLGAAGISAGQTLRWLLGGERDGTAHAILLYARLPRSLAAPLCGGALALSGALLQSALHNPLASAGTIGVNSGAGLFAVLAGALFPGVFAARPALAFAGAMLAALLVYGIGRRAGKSTLIMAGIAVGSLLSACTDAVVTLRPDSVMDRAVFFIGGFGQLPLRTVLLVLPLLAAGAVGAALLAARLNVLALGDEVAASLGMRVGRCRTAALLCAAGLAAAAVCLGGLLGFVGLIVPHGARLLAGHDHRRMLPLCALLGAALVTGCDIIARVAFAPYELPVGILLSLLGAPFFLVLVLRRRRLSL